MRVLLILLLCLVAFTSEATNYYVATAAGLGTNANTGLSPTYVSGTTGPWLDLTYALAHTAGGDTIWVNDGLYVEATYLNPTANYAGSMLTIASLNADRTKVTITGGGGLYSLYNRASSITFSNLTFTNYAIGATAIVRMSAGTNVWFYNCDITPVALADSKAGISILPYAATITAAVSNVWFINCTMKETGSGVNIFGLYNQSPNMYSGGIHISNCTVNIRGYPFYDEGYTHDVDINNSTFISTNIGACYINGATNYYFTNCQFTSYASLGFQAYKTNKPFSGLVLSSCTVTGTTLGVNIDGGTGLVIENSTLVGLGNSALTIGKDNPYETNAVMATPGMVSNNKLYSPGSGGDGCEIGVHADNLHFINNECHSASAYGLNLKTPSNIDVQYNRIYCEKSSSLLSALLLKGVLGGCVIKHNILYPIYDNYGVVVGTNAATACTNITFTDNWIVGNKPRAMWLWYTGGDVGGSTIDRNTYYFKGTPNIGTANGSAMATNFPMWLTNWATYGVAGNETHSAYGPTFSPGFAQ